MNTIKRLSETLGGKIIISLWLLVIVIIVGFVFFGLFFGDLLGNIVLSILPAAILADISIIVAYVVNKNSLVISRGIWLTLAFVVFVIAVMLGTPLQPTEGEEAGMVVGYPMWILAFPLNIPTMYIYGGISYLAELNKLNILQNLMNNIYVFWFSFFIVGYLQWFVLFPFLIKKWRSKHLQAIPK
jgi:hypothetical protein